MSLVPCPDTKTRERRPLTMLRRKPSWLYGIEKNKQGDCSKCLNHREKKWSGLTILTSSEAITAEYLQNQALQSRRSNFIKRYWPESLHYGTLNNSWLSSSSWLLQELSALSSSKDLKNPENLTIKRDLQLTEQVHTSESNHYIVHY